MNDLTVWQAISVAPGSAIAVQIAVCAAHMVSDTVARSNDLNGSGPEVREVPGFASRNVIAPPMPDIGVCGMCGVRE